MYRKYILIIIIFFLSSCSTYVYYGKIKALDSKGKDRHHLIYWTKTERTLWFDEVSGSIRLLTECSNRTVNFDETEDGIFFRCTPQDEGVGREVALNGPCGEVLNYKKVKNIPEGNLELKIYCQALTDDFSVGMQEYLMAGDSVYVFQVVKTEKDSFADGAPPRPDCRDNP